MKSLKDYQQQIQSKVVGQSDAINVLSTFLYKYTIKYIWKKHGNEFSGASSMLLLGPTGTGKTFLTRTAADAFGMPILEINAKAISQEGWSGTSFKTLLGNSFIEKGCPEAGIIFIDEIDKILVPNISSGGDDVNYHLQTSILKYIEGMEIIHENLKKPVYIDTNKFLFIFSGAFVGLNIKSKSSIGFKNVNIKDNSLTQALTEFGMIPELIGRLSETVLLNPLTNKDFKLILENENFHLKKWERIFNKLGLEFKVNIKQLIDNIKTHELGARILISEVEKVVTKNIIKYSDQINLINFWNDLSNSSGIESIDQ